MKARLCQRDKLKLQDFSFCTRQLTNLFMSFVTVFIQISYGLLFSYCLNNELKPVLPQVKNKEQFSYNAVDGVLPCGC